MTSNPLRLPDHHDTCKGCRNVMTVYTETHFDLCAWCTAERFQGCWVWQSAKPRLQ